MPAAPWGRPCSSKGSPELSCNPELAPTQPEQTAFLMGSPSTPFLISRDNCRVNVFVLISDTFVLFEVEWTHADTLIITFREWLIKTRHTQEGLMLSLSCFLSINHFTPSPTHPRARTSPLQQICTVPLEIPPETAQAYPSTWLFLLLFRGFWKRREFLHFSLLISFFSPGSGMPFLLSFTLLLAWWAALHHGANCQQLKMPACVL